MINSRLISDLTPEAQAAYLSWHDEMTLAQLPYMITSTLRDVEMQLWLWAQGRTRPGKIVTWTMRSRHLPRPPSNKSIAWDFAILIDPKKPTWDVKVDVNRDRVPDYKQAADLAVKLGLAAGFYFKNQQGEPQPDSVHIELNPFASIKKES